MFILIWSESKLDGNITTTVLTAGMVEQLPALLTDVILLVLVLCSAM